MKLAGGHHEGEPAPECDEEEKMATASSLEEEPGGHLNNKHMSQIPQEGENGRNVAFFNFFDAPLRPNSLIFSIFLDCSEEFLSITF